MSSNVPEKQTLEKDVEQRLSLKYDYTLLQEGRKTSLLFSIVFVGGPLAMAILFLSYTFTFAINNCSLYKWIMGHINSAKTSINKCIGLFLS